MRIFGKTPREQTVASFAAPPGIHPTCPYCEQQVDAVYTKEINMSLGKTWLFYCTECTKVLGTSQRKTVPMG